MTFTTVFNETLEKELNTSSKWILINLAKLVNNMNDCLNATISIYKGELKELSQLSRDTVKKALRDLMNKEYIEITQGLTDGKLWEIKILKRITPRKEIGEGGEIIQILKEDKANYTSIPDSLFSSTYYVHFKLCLIAILCLSKGERYFTQTRREIAKIIGCNLNYVDEYIKAVEELGHIKVTNTVKGAPKEYTVLFSRTTMFSSSGDFRLMREIRDKFRKPKVRNDENSTDNKKSAIKRRKVTKIKNKKLKSKESRKLSMDVDNLVENLNNKEIKSSSISIPKEKIGTKAINILLEKKVKKRKISKVTS